MAKGKRENKDYDEENDEQERERRAAAKPAAPAAAPEYGPPLYQPRAGLAVIVGGREITRTEAARKVWDYVKQRSKLRRTDHPSKFKTDQVLKDALDVNDAELTTADLTTRIRRVLR